MQSNSIQEFIYQESNSSKTVTSHCKLHQKTDGFAIQVIGGLYDETTNANFSSNWTQLSWASGNVSLSKKTGLVCDHLGRSIPMPSSPWIQDYTFSLQPFITSSQSKFTFTAINPTDCSKLDFIATKQGLEILSIAGQQFVAQKVNITFADWKMAWLWSGEGYFDTERGQLLRFEGKGTLPVGNFVKELVKII